MAGDVTSLEAVRRDGPSQDRTRAAADYVRRAEEAIALLAAVQTPDERAAVCRITETWLNLAEAELDRTDHR